MDDTQRIVKCGALALHAPGGFFKKRWPSKYLVLYDGSKSGIKRLELFDSEIKFKKQNPAKIIPLVDCVRVVTCQRNKTTYTFEVRFSDQFYLLAAASFQDMNDWVNCLRLVAFGQSPPGGAQAQLLAAALASKGPLGSAGMSRRPQAASSGALLDVLLEKRVMAKPQPPGPAHEPHAPEEAEEAAERQPLSAGRAAAAAASALAKSRQRQPSLLGSCKPQPPTDSPFLALRPPELPEPSALEPAGLVGQTLDTLTPAVRGQLIGLASASATQPTQQQTGSAGHPATGSAPALRVTPQTRPAASQRPVPAIPAALDEEEENMLYCSIEDNPSEHNYRVKVIETELSLRCQLKCYQQTAPTTVSQQYEQLGQIGASTGSGLSSGTSQSHHLQVTFYQLIVGPQELTLLNDYGALMATTSARQHQQQGLWSWPYQCIRRYGFDKDNCFMFEAGRKCTSGPGQFIVQTPKAYNIYQDVVKFVNELRSLNPDIINQSNSAQQADCLESGATSATTSSANAISGITQIPVNWIAPMNDPQAQDNQRQQFFDTLRQIGQFPEKVAVQDKQSIIHSNNLSKSMNNLAKSMVDVRNAPDITRNQSRPPSIPPKPANLTTMATTSASNSKCNSISTSEETDESGYDQGDESVDSSASNQKKLNVTSTNSIGGHLISNPRKQRQSQIVDSMSSASSTSSSESSDRNATKHQTTGASRQQSGCQTPILGQNNTMRLSSAQSAGNLADVFNNTKLGSHQNGNCVNGNSDGEQKTSRLLKMQSIIASSRTNGDNNLSNDPDFETNLIRDVYSEITKLHAQFAIASESAEDSMSSNSSRSSREDSGDSEVSNRSNGRFEEFRSSDGGEEGGGEEEEEDDDDDGFDEGRMARKVRSGRVAEPMYTNMDDCDSSNGYRDPMINARTTRNQNSRCRDEDRLTIHQRAPKNVPSSRNSRQHIELAANNPFNCSPPPQRGPMFPTTLNPIPECNESAVTGTTIPLGSRNPSVPYDGVVNINNNITPRSQATKANTHLLRPNNPRIQGVSKENRKIPAHCDDLMTPTNHYVINDVQYAKISRGWRSDLDSRI